MLTRLMMSLILSLPFLSAAEAQCYVNGILCGTVTPEQLAAMQASIPTPADNIGPAEQVGGAPGTATTYKRGDWTPPRISRTGSCVLSASGTCTLTWSTPFPAGVTPVMFGDPSAVNTTAQQPIDCDVTAAPTTTGVPIKCWIGQSSVVNILGASVLPFNSSSLAGVTATAAAIPASQ